MLTHRESDEASVSPILRKFYQTTDSPIPTGPLDTLSASRKLGIISTERGMGELGTAISRRVADLFTGDIKSKEPYLDPRPSGRGMQFDPASFW